MIGKSTLAAGLIALGAALAPATATPTLQSPIADVARVDISLVEQVGWRHRRHCRNWRQECAARWGWQTNRFHRCMGRHGC